MRGSIRLLMLAMGLLIATAARAQVDLERACPNCSPFYCPANPETQRLLEEKRQMARDRGYPQRIVNLLDRVFPVCPACLEQGSDVPLIFLYPAGDQPSPIEWTANNERIARGLFRQGRIDGYYIRWIGPCECCGHNKPPPFFDSSGAVRDTLGIRQGVLRYETREQVDAVKDAGGSKIPIPEKETFADPKPPRIAQALCPECTAAAEAINKAERAHYEALLADVERKRERETLKVETAKLHNARVDLYNAYDAGRISWDAYLKESERLRKRDVALEDRFLAQVSVPVYRRIKAAIRKSREEADQALAKAQDCEARLCRKPERDETASEEPPAGDTMAGAPPARHGLKPKLICGRFPPHYWEACFREIQKYYAVAEAHSIAVTAAERSPMSPEEDLAACLKGCDFVHAPWVLADWARRTALEVVEENRIRALEKADNQKRRAAVQAWAEQARVFWSEGNTSINSCTAAEAERRHGNCRSGCTGGAKAGDALTCAVHPLSAVSQYQWLSNLYPPGVPQLAGVEPDTPAAIAQRKRVLDTLRQAEQPLGASPHRPVLPKSPRPASKGR